MRCVVHDRNLVCFIRLSLQRKSVQYSDNILCIHGISYGAEKRSFDQSNWINAWIQVNVFTAQQHFEGFNSHTLQYWKDSKFWRFILQDDFCFPFCELQNMKGENIVFPWVAWLQFGVILQRCNLMIYGFIFRRRKMLSPFLAQGKSIVPGRKPPYSNADRGGFSLTPRTVRMVVVSCACVCTSFLKVCVQGNYCIHAGACCVSCRRLSSSTYHGFVSRTMHASFSERAVQESFLCFFVSPFFRFSFFGCFLHSTKRSRSSPLQ